MKHQTFAVWDAAAAAYLPPFHLPRNEIAMRAFRDCVNDPNHQFAQHSEDYRLFHLGEFDDTTGVFTANARGPTVLTTALAVKGARESANSTKENG